jgi:hypothetical protein
LTIWLVRLFQLPGGQLWMALPSCPQCAFLISAGRLASPLLPIIPPNANGLLLRGGTPDQYRMRERDDDT